jgi:hypothetical protein
LAKDGISSAKTSGESKKLNESPIGVMHERNLSNLEKLS